LIELLIVMVLIAILLAIAVPSYLGFKNSAEERAAKANIRAALPAMTAFRLDNTGHRNDADGRRRTTGFRGVTVAILRSRYDSGLASHLSIYGRRTNTTQYCLVYQKGSQVWSALGPGISGSSYVNNARCR
jgi:type IV pilus assembly protein PilA